MVALWLRGARSLVIALALMTATLANTPIAFALTAQDCPAVSSTDRHSVRCYWVRLLFRAILLLFVVIYATILIYP